MVVGVIAGDASRVLSSSQMPLGRSIERWNDQRSVLRSNDASISRLEGCFLNC